MWSYEEMRGNMMGLRCIFFTENLLQEERDAEELIETMKQHNQDFEPGNQVDKCLKEE